jgi:predicted TIM-barrel fold metal-dependent hydrolase
MDSHTEAFVDIKPFLPSEYHAAFDEGMALIKYSLGKGVEFFANFVASQENIILSSGQDTLPELTRPITVEEYAKPLPIDQRIVALDEDGVAAEFITPFSGALSRSLDVEFMHEVTLAYNRWFARYFEPAPERFAAACALTLRGGIDLALKEIDHAYENGIYAVTLSGKARNVAVDLPYYDSPFYEPLWAALNERKMAAVFHVGYGREKPLLRWEGQSPGWEIGLQRDLATGHLEALPYILAAGVLERHPDLHIGYVESGNMWIAPILAELDAYVKNTPGGLQHKFELLPSEQWHRQGFTGDFFDPETIENRQTIGVSNICWGSDYPHVESSWPHSREHLTKLLADVPVSERNAILCGNAARIMNFDLAKLQATKAAHVPWPMGFDSED